MKGLVNSIIVSHKMRKKWHGKLFEQIKESKWGTYCKSSQSNILETQVIFPIASELTRTLLPVESISNKN